MEYLIFGTIIIILVWLAIHRLNTRKSKRAIAQIRSGWGKPKTDQFYFNNIRKFADTVKADGFHRLTEQTIDDIDLYGLFAFIDRTTSKIGQQFLFKKLIEPTNNTQSQSAELIELFSRDRDLREEVQFELRKLNHKDAYYISSLFHDDLLQEPKWFKLLILDIVIIACLIVLSFWSPVFLIMLIVPITLNTVLHYSNKSKTFQFSRSFTQLNLLIDASARLLRKGSFLDRVGVDKSISDLRSFQRKTSLIAMGNGSGFEADLSLIATYFIELIKASFLVEVFTLFDALKEIEKKKSSIITLFNYVGNIDASISVASLRSGTMKTCLPVFTCAKKEVVVKNIYHPLIDDCVRNSLSIRNKSILITGSNMSGKSTFLRTLVINSILAQTIHTCFADEFCSPVLRQFSSIRIDDDLFEGASYYFQEVNLMASLLGEVGGPYQNLFVLDEVFKGTNTVERIAAAKAILSYLNRNDNIVIVSTHDIELADMLEDEFDLYHFTETVEDNELRFDHVIKGGQLKTRNAIRILELSNYPADIIHEAREIAATLRTARILKEE